MNSVILRIPAKEYRATHSSPASWGEINGEQLLFIAATFGSSLPVEKAMQILAVMLYQIDIELVKHIPERHLERLAQSIKYVLARNELSQWLIPVLKLRLRKYYGPKDELENITVEEFTFTELCYERYQQTGKVEYLETLAAILYRPCRWRGIESDIRIKFTEYGYIKRARKFMRLTKAMKVAIYLNYEGCRNLLHVRYPVIFEKEKKVKAGNTTSLTGWDNIVHSAAGDIFGPLLDTRQANLHDFLKRLSTRMKDAKEFEAKYGNK